jgi:folate-binding protein YgfZ
MKTNKMNSASEFDAIMNSVGLVDRSDRVRLLVTGPDRAKFLHNLTTNDVRHLAVGRGCETFVTSTQGKTIGYLILLADEDRLIARSDPGGALLVLPHFRQYGVFDEVSIDDLTSSTFELHVLGPLATELARRADSRLPDETEYAHVATELGGHPIRLVRESPALLPGLTLIGERPAARAVKESLLEHGRDLGLVEVDAESFEVLRIAAGTPVFGKDITAKNLPQELGRDDRAINFVKGCYLGQETVARIDALGHVNQVLKGLQLEAQSPCPEPGTPLEQEGKRVGVVTSAAFSPVAGAAVALGLIRTTHSQAGTRLGVKPAQGTQSAVAIVSDLPMSVRP